MKSKRIVDKNLIKQKKLSDCTACFKDPPVDAHHLKSQKSGGHDLDSNLLPLCRFCHSLLHLKGLNYMAQAYPNIQAWLESNGWSKEQGKWRRWK